MSELISRAAALEECLKSEKRGEGVGARDCIEIRDAIRELPTVNNPKPDTDISDLMERGWKLYDALRTGDPDRQPREGEELLIIEGLLNAMVQKQGEINGMALIIQNLKEPKPDTDIAGLIDRLDVCIQSEDGYWPTILAKNARDALESLQRKKQRLEQALANSTSFGNERLREIESLQRERDSFEKAANYWKDNHDEQRTKFIESRHEVAELQRERDEARRWSKAYKAYGKTVRRVNIKLQARVDELEAYVEKQVTDWIKMRQKNTRLREALETIASGKLPLTEEKMYNGLDGVRIMRPNEFAAEALKNET